MIHPFPDNLFYGMFTVSFLWRHPRSSSDFFPLPLFLCSEGYLSFQFLYSNPTVWEWDACDTQGASAGAEPHD